MTKSTHNKRTHAQIVADRLLITELLLEGQTMFKIAQHINSIREYQLSYSQIVYDCRAIEKQWMKEYLGNIDTMKAKELARIDRIEQAAWDAWEASKRTLAQTEKEQTENEQLGRDDKAYQKHRKVRAKKVETERDADEKFMKIIQWCVEQRCKILGFNAPQKLDINWRKQAEAAGMSPDKVKEELVNQFVSYAKQGLDRP